MNCLAAWTKYAVAMTFAMMCSCGYASIAVQPACPSSTDDITLVATGPSVQRDPLALEVRGTTVRLVAQAFNSGFTLPPYTEVRGTIAPLPIGKYRIEFYTRIQPNGLPGGDTSTLLPERFEEAGDFEVYSVPPTCAPVYVEPVGSTFSTAEVGRPYLQSQRFKVTDAHRNPVPNYALHLYRRGPPSEPATNGPVPDFAQPTTTVVTDSDGIATLAGTANQVPGAFHYVAFLTNQNRPPWVAYGLFYNRPQGSLEPDYPVLEFVRTLPDGMQHFFLTGVPTEAAQLDLRPEWQRTFEVFMTFAPVANRAGTSPVCRFYGLPAAGLDSHFFSADANECDAVRQRFANAWVIETTDAFEVYMPNRDTGACPAQTRKVYRGYNNRPDANHRYAFTHDIAVLNAHPPSGPYWTLEGYGQDSVVMCIPQ